MHSTPSEKFFFKLEALRYFVAQMVFARYLVNAARLPASPVNCLKKNSARSACVLFKFKYKTDFCVTGECLKASVAGFSSACTNDIKTYDVVIAGGGMVGCSLAAAIAKEPMLKELNVLLLESASEKVDWQLSQQYSNRVCALNSASKKLLEAIGAWEKIEALRLQPVKEMQVWEATSDAKIAFHSNDGDALAYIVENDVILHSIVGCIAKENKNISIKFGTRAEIIDLPMNSGDSFDSPYVRLSFSDGSSIHTKLLVGADGANSVVRKAAGIETIGRQYRQSGVVATLNLRGADVNKTAWQRFMPEGPIALLPLDEEHSSLVWSTTPNEAKRLIKLTDEAFTDALNSKLWDDSGKSPTAVAANNFLSDFLSNFQGVSRMQQLPPTVIGTVPDSRAAFPLGLQLATKLVTHRLALIGDAAHRVHPLAGQGVNLGFADVSELTKTLVNGARLGADVGSLGGLLGYETARLRHAVPMGCSLDALHSLYGNRFPPIVVARALGLQLVDTAFEPLKAFFLKKARFGN